MWDGGIFFIMIWRSCILTDFSWTTPFNFLDIMMGSPSCPELFSLIFEVRTFIFGQNVLCPYVVVRVNFHNDLKKLHFDRFFMDHPISFSQYNDWASVVPGALLAHFWSEDVHLWNLSSLSICGTEEFFAAVSEDIDRFFMDQPLRFSPYNDRVSVVPGVVLAHFWSEGADIWPKWSLSICGTAVWFAGVSEEVAFWPIFHGPPY